MKVELKKMECDLQKGTSKNGKPYSRLSILDRVACERISVFCPDDVLVTSSEKYNITLNLSATGKYYFDSISKA